MKLSSPTCSYCLLSATTALCFASSSILTGVDSHAWMPIPVSRNQYAVSEGDWGAPKAGKPRKETTPQGLNSNTNVCGSQGSNNYDAWLDSEGNPMPWISQANYDEGAEIRVDVNITAHHFGHFTVSACPRGRQSTQDCFDDNPLEFVRDLKTGMPKDEDHPHRAMLWGDADRASYLFRLPDGLSGDEVLLQWIYWTANSCKYDGYDNYFETHRETIPPADKGNWGPGLSDCGPVEEIPLIRQGTVIAEIFVNCAEVSVGEENGGGSDDEEDDEDDENVFENDDDDDEPSCTDTDESFKVGKKQRNCKWASKANGKNCKKKLKEKVNGKKKFVREMCPVACDRCSVAPPSIDNNTGGGCEPGCNCVAIPQQQLSQGSWQTVDGNCAACAHGQEHWPCNLDRPICRCSNLRRK